MQRFGISQLVVNISYYIRIIFIRIDDFERVQGVKGIRIRVKKLKKINKIEPRSLEICSNKKPIF